MLKIRLLQKESENKFYLRSLSQNAIDITPGNVTGRKETEIVSLLISQTKMTADLQRSL